MLYCLKLTTLVMVMCPGLMPFQQKFSPRKEALALFNKYKPVIERRNNAIVDNPAAIVGDINGDGKDDCIVSFVMTSRNGGNAIIGHESAIYLNTGKRMKVAGAFPSYTFCFKLNHIKDQVIYAKEYECKPPYKEVLRERKFAYRDGKVAAID